MTSYFHRPSITRIIAVALMVLSCCGRSHMAVAQEQELTAEMLNEQLKQLGDSSYAVRENASEFLRKHPDQVMPLIVDRLTTNQAQSQSPLPEASLRMFRLLSGWAADPATPTGTKAFESLQRLSQGTSLVTTLRAQSLMTEMMLEYSEVVEARLQSLGAFIGQQPVQVGALQDLDRRILRLDDNFRGDAESLDTLRWLVDIDLIHARGKIVTRHLLENIGRMPRLQVLQLREAEITADDLTLIHDIKGLQVLEILYTPLQTDALSELAQLPVGRSMRLFGTGLEPAAIEQLKSQLEGVEVLYGRGGFLGIMAGFENVIGTVMTKGAAEQAGLRKDDKIVAINQIPTAKFDDIRAELAKYGPKDKVNIDFERKGIQVDDNGHQSIVWRPMSTEVTLGMQD